MFQIDLQEKTGDQPSPHALSFVFHVLSLHASSYYKLDTDLEVFEEIGELKKLFKIISEDYYVL